eukprot:Tamp_15430.p1 GENE.Tamp_15430~~Tamp_15430.p1  ORF type:complete len:441 (+),score=97.24 Tamp_15430:33-1325(+)
MVRKFATHNYTGTNVDELSFRAGDALEVLGPSVDQGWYRAYRNGQTGVVPANYLSDYLSDSAGTAAAHVAIQEAHAPVPTTVQAHATASEQQPAVPDMLPDLQAILDMLVSNSIQDPRAVEKHIAGSPFLNTQSAEAALLSSIMRQMSKSLAGSAAQAQEMQQLPQAGQGRADNAQRLLNEALLQEQQALLREQQGLLEAADQRLLNEALLREQKSEAMYKGLLEAADRESKVRIDTLTRQNAGLTEQLKQAVKAASDARVLTDRAMSDSTGAQEMLEVQQNRILELESALNGAMREHLVRSSRIHDVTQRIGEQRKSDQTRMEEMSSQLQAQENVLYLFRQGWTMDASGQLRQPLVKQTPTEGDNMKAGGYPFVNRDQNPGETLASLDPLSVTTKATIYDSAHVLEKAMLLEKTIRSAKERYAPEPARP